MSIVVFGSINMDLVVRSPRLPKAGETIVGHTFFTAAGGKGANQAVAAGKLGAEIRLFGSVGDDVFAETLRQSLLGYGVNIDGVVKVAGVPSGVALITVDDNAENNIVIVPGANDAFPQTSFSQLEAALAQARILLLQLEVPIEQVIHAAKMAKTHGVTVILDPAPARQIPDELYRLADVITPNETETQVLTGITVNSQQDAAKAAAELQRRGVRYAVIKQGSKGVYWSEAGAASEFVPVFKVKAIDTVAAGDAFNGGLALALSEGKPFAEAIRWGSATGAISTTRQGAQPSMPSRAEVEQCLRDGTFGG